LNKDDNKKNTRKIKKDTNKTKNNTRNLFNLYSLNITRCEDIKTLIRTRNEHRGTREMSLFLYAIHFMRAYKNLENPLKKLEENLFELNNLFNISLDAKEINRKIIHSIERVYERYNYSNKRIIEVLQIQPSEMKYLKTIISKKEKRRRDRKNKRKKRRNKNGLTPKQQEIKNRRISVSKLLKTNLTQSKIAKKLNVSRSTIKRDVRKIKKQDS
jgi:DNA-binding CsgD family transcriptional regulator